MFLPVLFKAKAILIEEHLCYYLTHRWGGITEVFLFPQLLLLFDFLGSFFTPALADGFPLEFKGQQVSRTLLSILTDLNNAVVWMISTCSLISKSSSHCIKALVTVTRAPIIIGITVTFMFHNFFNSLARSWYLSI